MNIMPINFIILSAIPEAIATVFLGLYLLGVKPPIKRVVIVGILQGIALYFIKKHTGYEVSFILQTISVVILTSSIVKVTPLCSLLANLAGASINILLEAGYMIAFLKVSQYTFPEIISREWLRIAYATPKIIVLLLIIGLCIKYKITLEEEITFMGKNNGQLRL